jgi:hypothetical protein
MGPIILTYIWIEIIVNRQSSDPSAQNIFLGLCTNAYFTPIVIFGLTLIIQQIAKYVSGKKK